MLCTIQSEKCDINAFLMLLALSSGHVELALAIAQILVNRVLSSIAH